MVYVSLRDFLSIFSNEIDIKIDVSYGDGSGEVIYEGPKFRYSSKIDPEKKYVLDLDIVYADIENNVLYTLVEDF